MSAKVKAREFACTVQSFEMITPTVFHMGFTTPEPVGFAAGQFVSVIVPKAGPGGRDLRRAYSIASAPENPTVELCVKLVEGGPGTNYLYKMRPGDVFKGFAPYGDFVYVPKAGRDAVLISTGTGIAPFRSMMGSALFNEQKPRKTWCLLGVRTESELLYTHEMAHYFGQGWMPIVSQPEYGDYSGRRGRVTDILRDWAKQGFAWGETEFYLCGNGAMITEVVQILTDNGVLKDSIHKEKYY